MSFMKLLKQKIESLTEILESELENENFKLGIAINELKCELDKFREIEIYREDFSDVGWSYVSKNNEISSLLVYSHEA
jgi:hypothetical protein